MAQNTREIIEKISIKDNPKIAIIASRFNETIVDKLVAGAMQGFNAHGVPEENIHLYRVPGAFELPLIAQSLAPHYAGCIALGVIIRGETPHFDYVAAECARGIQQVALNTGKPMMFGVLTTENEEQAIARAGGNRGNKGFDVAVNLLEMLNLLANIKL